MRTATVSISVAVSLALVAQTAMAVGDPTRRAERLQPTEIDAVSGFSIREYDLETGVYYRWRITGDGVEEYEVAAEELFENSWVEKVSVDDATIVVPDVVAIELGGDVEVDIWFVPIRPGDHPFGVEGREQDEGFSGVMHVR